ncbi:MAG: hypothetical protein ACYDGM_10150 [Vulcanimicrobiaceae bacterium]
MALNDQVSFANTGFERYKKTTKRAMFLDEMDRIMPWEALCSVIAPFYSKGESGRPPIELERIVKSQSYCKFGSCSLSGYAALVRSFVG